MLPELGQITLLVALTLSLLLSTLPMLGAHKSQSALMQTARPLAYSLLVAVLFS